MQRFLASEAPALCVTPVDATEQAITITAAVSITIKDGAGVTIATGVPVLAADKHSMSFTPAAALATLDSYAATWVGTVGAVEKTWTTEFETVGGRLFTVAKFRETNRAYTDTTKYPFAAVEDARRRAEDRLHEAANLAFVRRGGRLTVTGNNRTRLTLPDFSIRGLYKVLVDDVDVSAETFVLLDNVVERQATIWPAYVTGLGAIGSGNIDIHYWHGLDSPPEPIAYAAMVLCGEYLQESMIPSRATAQTVGDQTYRITIAGRDGSTGIPEVDEIIRDFGRRRLSVG